MRVINGGKTGDNPDAKAKDVRLKILAKIHIAKKELGFSDLEYREILNRLHRVKSATTLSIPELEEVLRYFRKCGWRGSAPKKRGPQKMIQALQKRCKEIAGIIPNGLNRLDGISEKIGGVKKIEWVQDVKKLKRILAILEKIAKEEK
jgi:hypothetical protein